MIHNFPGKLGVEHLDMARNTDGLQGSDPRASKVLHNVNKSKLFNRPDPNYGREDKGSGRQTINGNDYRFGEGPRSALFRAHPYEYTREKSIQLSTISEQKSTMRDPSRKQELQQ